MKKINGQILIGSLFGNMLVKYSALPEIKNVVEIGTWEGEGSTACIVKGLSESAKDKIFVSIESNLSKYTHASKIYKESWIKILHGRIIDVPKITFDFSILVEPQKSWAKDDLEDYSSCENVLNHIPERIDMLLLDGGEFTTFDEFMLLKDRTKFFFLDDTQTLKNKSVLEYIISSGQYNVIMRNNKERNGIAIVEKRS